MFIYLFIQHKACCTIYRDPASKAYVTLKFKKAKGKLYAMQITIQDHNKIAIKSWDKRHV